MSSAVNPTDTAPTEAARESGDAARQEEPGTPIYPDPTATPPQASSEPTPVSTEAAATPANNPEPTEAPPTETAAREGPVGGKVGDWAAEVEGIEAWINSEPLTIAGLKGKVVLVDFWTYTCVNCIRTFPYLKLWNSRYADDGLVILGIHSPEFEFEKDPGQRNRSHDK